MNPLLALLRELSVLLLLLPFTVAPALGEIQHAQLEIEAINSENAPIANAILELRPALASASGLPVNSAYFGCDTDGRCVATNIIPGSYFVSLTYGDEVARIPKPLTLKPGYQHLVMRVAEGTASLVGSLGVVRVAPSGSLSTASAPSLQVDAQSLAHEGQLNAVSALASAPGVTLNRPNGGSSGLPGTIMIRGDDPKESIVEIDGNPINNGNSGDFDLSLVDPAAFQSVQLVYGLAPASLVGANTEGGTINFQTLQPTLSPHGYIQYSLGSFLTNGYAVAATGSAEKFGYAFEGHVFNQQGQVSTFPVQDAATGLEQNLGSAIFGSSALIKLTYSLPHEGLLQASVLTSGYDEDLSAALSSPVNPNDALPNAQFTSYAGSERQDVNTFYSVRAQLPLGSLNDQSAPAALITANYMFAHSRQNVTGPANGLSEYLLNTSDTLGDYSLQYDHVLPAAQFTLVARAQGEILSLPDSFGVSTPTQSQTNHTFIARYTWSGGTRLEYTAVGYASTFSTFGSSFNPRAAVVWRPQWRTVVRGSVGTGFQAPLLSEKIVPSPLPPPTADGLIEVGNPNLTADHTEEFELDASQILGVGARACNAELDLYHVNQSDDDIQFIPARATPKTPKLSYPVNIATSVWQGLALNVRAPFGWGFAIDGSYDLNQGYPLSLPLALNGSAGNLVPHEQFQGVPLHRATLSLQQHLSRLSWSFKASYEGTNNELNQPAFATVDADAVYNFGHASIGLHAMNVTGAYDGNFTLVDAGTPYAGLSGPILTNAYQLPKPSLTASLAQHW